MMKGNLWMIAAAGVLALGLYAHAQQDSFREALARYDKSVEGGDVETVKGLLAPEVLLFEHSVRNDGLADVFENHLKPEILEAKNWRLDYSDARITPGAELTLVTRQYRIHGSVEGKAVDSAGNETLVWKKGGNGWKIVHIHYSHACPKPPQK